jgi:bacterioferritin (cytochrome b1)
MDGKDLSSEKDLRRMIKAQIELERSTSKSIREMEDVTSNLEAKLLLAEMRFDTEKHSKVLQMLLDLVEMSEPSRTTRSFWQRETREYVDALAARNRLERHVTAEMSMLRRVTAMMEKTDDAAVKTLFRHILADEKKHHKIMENMLKKAFKIHSVP